MRKDILDLVKGTPSHRVKSKKAHKVFDQSERFIVKSDRSKEGSRGGEVIGHTSSGKAIYASSKKHAADHKHFDAADHKSAHEVHHNIAIGHNDAGDKAMAAGNTDKAYDHWHASDYHMEQSEQHEFAHHKKAGKRLPGHLAHWRESGGPPASDGDLRDHAVKINQQHNSSKHTATAQPRRVRAAVEKSEAYSPDLVKGGWHSIPGGKHGGERRKHGAAWEYRYPDHDSRKKAVSHHENKGYELRDKARAARRSGDRAKAAQLEDQAGDHMHAADSAHANSPQNNEFSGGGVHIPTLTVTSTATTPRGKHASKTWSDVFSEYEKNEDDNDHTKNAILLAEALGQPASTIKQLKEIKARSKKNGWLSSDDNSLRAKLTAGHYRAAKRHLAEVKKSVGDNPDLLKAKGGWQPIPGGKHGGERKRGSYGHWEYRYASKESAKQAADHHESKRKAVYEKIEAHNKEYDFDSPSFNWDKYDEHGEAESEKLSNDHSHHADQRDAARHFAQHGHGPATYLDSYDSHSHDHHGDYDDEERQRGWNYAHPKNDSHGYTVTQSGDKNKFEVHHGERHGHGHVEASEKVGTARSREAAMAMLHRHAKTPLPKDVKGKPLPPVKKSAASELQKAIVAYDQAVRSTR